MENKILQRMQIPSDSEDDEDDIVSYIVELTEE